MYPGGKLEAKNLYVNVDALYVDVMGTLSANGQGYCNMGIHSRLPLILPYAIFSNKLYYV